MALGERELFTRFLAGAWLLLGTPATECLGRSDVAGVSFSCEHR